MKEIILTKGYVTIVNDEDFDWLNQWDWRIHKSCKTFYAARGIRIEQKYYIIFMHNEIVINRMNLEIFPKHEVDHIDRKGLHNWRNNLKVVTRSIQKLNTNVRKDNILKIKGICFCNRDKKYIAYFNINGEQVKEYFNTKKEAIIWRQEKEIKYYGKIIP